MNIPRRSKLSHQSKSFTRYRRTRIILIVALAVVLLLGILWGISKTINAQAFHIDSVQIFGADPEIMDFLNQVSIHTLEGNDLGMYSRRSSLIYPHGSLVDSIVSASPRIAGVTVRRDGWHSLIVTVTQKIPAAVICTTLPDWNDSGLDTNAPDSCYFADATGYIFEPATGSMGHIYNRYYVPDLLDSSTASDSAVGHFATSSREFNSLQTFYSSVKLAGISADAILVRDSGEYELYAAQKFISTSTQTIHSDPLVIYFNNTRSFDVQLSNLTSFWSRTIGDKASKKNGGGLGFEYLDIRYGSNVFYRLIK